MNNSSENKIQIDARTQKMLIKIGFSPKDLEHFTQAKAQDTINRFFYRVRKAQSFKKCRLEKAL